MQMKNLIISLCFVLIILMLSSCDKCRWTTHTELFYFTAIASNAPDTIHVNEKITFQYILLKDSAAISLDSFQLEKYVQLHTSRSKEMKTIQLTPSFKTSNKELNSDPDYIPEITIKKASNFETGRTNVVNGESKRIKILALDEIDRYIIEYEVSFKDTGLFYQAYTSIQTFVCCPKKDCNEITNGDIELIPMWPINNTRKVIGGYVFPYNGTEMQFDYPIYVIQ